MEDHSKYIEEVIDERLALEIKIADDAQQQIGVLKPVTRSLLNDAGVIAKMTRWRNQAKRHFLTQFTATEARTKRWLEDVVLTDYSRLLLLLYSPTKLIGQFGFKGLSNDTVEIDNLIRGEIGGHPHLIYYSEIALVNWLFHTFSISSISGFVLLDNVLTLNLHQSTGFRKTERIPLQRIEREGEVYLQMKEAGSTNSGALFVQKLELHRSDFKIERE